MLAKVITLSHGSRGKGFGAVLHYILRAKADAPVVGEQSLESGHINLKTEPLWTVAEDATGFAQDVAVNFDNDVRRCRARGRFRGNPVYHVAVSWKSGERPTTTQVRSTCRHVMRALGFQECQAVWSIHRDTDNDHVHLVINRVHPTTFMALSVPRRDFLVLDRCMRELELKLGFGRDQGPYVTLDTEAGPKTLRMSRAERETRGLMNDPDAPRLTVRAQRAERNLDGASFQRWLAGTPAAALKRAIEEPGATWQTVHSALGKFGCAIQPKGSGMVVTTTLSEGRVLAAKASIMGRWAGKAALERMLGPYAIPAPEAQKRAHLAGEAYEKFLHRERQRRLEPRSRRDEPRLLARRAVRAEARRALAQQFAEEQVHIRTERVRQRQRLRTRHEQERRALLETHRGQRRDVRVAARRRGCDGRVALSLWAFRAAAERERLQHRQAAGRRELTDQLPRSEVWRLWLERQAAIGDEAAKAALRGMRYRKRRNQRREDGLEGDDPRDLRPLTVEPLRAQVHASGLFIIYRRVDGMEAFRDTGPRIEMRDKSDDTLEAALRIAAQKYGGHVQITGGYMFRERAARKATRLGLVVHNADLQEIVADEKRRMSDRCVERPASGHSLWVREGYRARSRTRGLER